MNFKWSGAAAGGVLALVVLKCDMAERGVPCPIPDSYLFDWGYGGPLLWNSSWDKTRRATHEKIEQFWRGLPPAPDSDRGSGSRQGAENHE